MNALIIKLYDLMASSKRKNRAPEDEGAQRLDLTLIHHSGKTGVEPYPLQVASYGDKEVSNAENN
ncbi:hypothetical protein MIB92_18340 [Aestuariirhabdus sp. Z084]|nr:hypothetical protein [Aestuariirhabdus haliotis]MCL6417625.1 hypothetical protein [Aestuariirhabdus haliotis]MCL6421551.1 hypothetical protein [Aestuariirhabdus haliotis]